MADSLLTAPSLPLLSPLLRPLHSYPCHVRLFTSCSALCSDIERTDGAALKGLNINAVVAAPSRPSLYGSRPSLPPLTPRKRTDLERASTNPTVNIDDALPAVQSFYLLRN